MAISAEDYVEYYYYNNVIGCYPFDTDKERHITLNTINYLLDSHVPDKIILNMLESTNQEKAYIEPSDLPDFIWEGSLTNRDTFYYHRALQIIEPEPILLSNGTFKTFPPFIEITAHFTMTDLIDYMYKNIRNIIQIRDDRDNAGKFNYLLNRYKALPFQALDVVLALIDEAEYLNIEVSDAFNLKDREVEVIDKLTRIDAEARCHGKNKIIWRA